MLLLLYSLPNTHDHFIEILLYVRDILSLEKVQPVLSLKELNELEGAQMV